MYYDRVTYELNYKGNSLIIPEPLNWSDDNVTFERNLNYHGIFTSITDELEFIEEAADFITGVKNKYGTNENIYITKKYKNQNTGKWENSYYAVLDLTTYSLSNRVVKCNSVTSDTAELLKSRQSERIEINLSENLDGNPISQIATKTLALDGRRIMLISKAVKPDLLDEPEFLELPDVDDQFIISITIAIRNKIEFSADEHFTETVSYPLNVRHQIMHTPPNAWNLSAGDMIYLQSPQDKTINFKIDLKANLQIAIWDNLRTDIQLNIVIVKFSDYSNYTNPVFLYSLDNVAHSISHTEPDPTLKIYSLTDIEFHYDDNISLLAGESVGMYIEIIPISGIKNNSTDDQDVKVVYKFIDYYNIEIHENSYQEPSQSTCVLAHELLQHSLSLIGAGKLKSDFFGRTELGYASNGVGALTALTHGFWIRKFETNDRFRPMKVSFKDLYESLDTIYPIGLAIEKQGTSETILIEDRSYFYQRFTSIKFDNVFNLKREIIGSLHYSSVEVGFEEPSGANLYDEAMGLDEQNVKTNYSTIITKTKNKKIITSKYRADAYGVEFARRKTIATHPTTDTRYDESIFMIDVERTNDINYVRTSKWDDDLDVLPTGIFSPETAFNLMFSPARILFRHAQYIKQALIKYGSSLFRFISSDGNGNMITIQNGVEIKERANVIVGNTPQARHGAEHVTFDVDMSQSIRDMINGTTNGISNLYGYVQFVNENGKIEKGYLESIKGNQIKVIV
jgi:hypothetical protein